MDLGSDPFSPSSVAFPMKVALVGLALVGLALASFPSSAHTPGAWQLLNAAFAPDPANPANTALRVQTHIEPSGLLAFGFASVGLPHGVQIADFDGLAFDSYFESGGCGGGSPRLQLGVDLDGDDVRDANVHVYGGTPPNFDGCGTATWVHHDLTDGATRFDTGQIGGTFYDTQANADALAGPGHQVLTVALVWDSTWFFGPSTMFFDNLDFDCMFLGEPGDLAVGLAAGQGLVCP